MSFTELPAFESAGDAATFDPNGDLRIDDSVTFALPAGSGDAVTPAPSATPVVSDPGPVRYDAAALGGPIGFETAPTTPAPEAPVSVDGLGSGAMEFTGGSTTGLDLGVPSGGPSAPVLVEPMDGSGIVPIDGGDLNFTGETVPGAGLDTSLDLSSVDFVGGDGAVLANPNDLIGSSDLAPAEVPVGGGLESSAVEMPAVSLDAPVVDIPPRWRSRLRRRCPTSVVATSVASVAVTSATSAT